MKDHDRGKADFGNLFEAVNRDEPVVESGWDTMSKDRRRALAKELGWVSGNGLSETGREIVKSDWVDLSPAARRLLGGKGVTERDMTAEGTVNEFHTVAKTVNAGNAQRMNQRMHIKRFKSAEDMHAFLNKQTNNDWKESKHDLKSGKYVCAGGKWQNVKGIDPSALAHM